MRRLVLIVSLGISCVVASPFAAMADAPPLREDHPDRHVVVKGDTLWDISAKFLKSPWRWPELWHANDDRIKNPHLIYPGDVVYLVLTPGGPRLDTLAAVKLSPSIHAEPLARDDAIPPIPYAAVQAFLQRPLVADPEALAQAPRLLGSEDGRGLSSVGDRVYASGAAANAADWNIVRVGKPLTDPASGELLAREVLYVGDARVRALGSPATLDITRAEHEAQTGDYLLPAGDPERLDFVPHAPDRPIAGQIISVMGSSLASGRYATVIINKGKADGIESGQVLAVSHPGKSVGRGENDNRLASFSPKSGYLDSAKERGHNAPYRDFDGAGPATTADETVQLPDVRTGLIMVYRVFDRVAYALVMESSNTILPLDRVSNP